MRDSNALFINLRPPAGGLQRLQRSLACGRAVAGQRRRRFAAAAALALSLLLLVSLLPAVVSRQQQVSELRSAMRAALAPLANGIRVSDGAAIELPTGNPGIRLYLVQSTLMTLPPAGHGATREMR